MVASCQSQPASISTGSQDAPVRSGDLQHEAEAVPAGPKVSHDPAAAVAAAEVAENHADDAADPAADVPAEHISASDATAPSVINGNEDAALTLQTAPNSAEQTAWQRDEHLTDNAKENSSLLANPPEQKHSHPAQQDDSSDLLCMPSTPDLPAEQSSPLRNSPKRKRAADSHEQLKLEALKTPNTDAGIAPASGHQQDMTPEPLSTSSSESHPVVERLTGGSRLVDDGSLGLSSASTATTAAGPSMKASGSQAGSAVTRAETPSDALASGSVMQEKAARWGFDIYTMPSQAPS